MSPLETIRQNPAIRKILSFEQLTKASVAPCGDPALKSHILEELILRCWLVAGGSSFNQHRWAPTLKKCLQYNDFPPAALIRISAWLEAQPAERDFVLPDISYPHSMSDFSGVLQQELDLWKNANGLIPFVPTHSSKRAEVILLPFSILPDGDDRSFILQTSGHQPISAMESGAQQALDVARSNNWWNGRNRPRIMLGSIEATLAEELKGASAGLPILAALYLQHRQHKPAPFKFGISGVLNPTGKIDAKQDKAGLRRKLACLQSCGCKTIILPSCGSKDNRVKWCSSRESLDKWLPIALGLPRTNASGLDRNKIERNLTEISQGMRYGKLTPEAAVHTLKPMIKELDKHKDMAGRQYLAKAKLLLATVECHRGNPTLSHELINEVKQEAKVIGPYFTGKALATQAVVLTDMMKYKEAILLCQRIIKLCTKVSNALECLNLELSARGTMGQARTYWALVNPQQKQPAIKDLQKALKLAIRYDQERKSVNLQGQDDEPRERNYIFMWHAYHAPTSPQANQAYQQARKCIGRDSGSNAHLIRLHWLAAYRALLAGKAYPWKPFEHELPDKETGWVFSISLKYRGALRAAAGDNKGATQDLKDAVGLIQQQDAYPLLGFIGGICDLEAGRSLGRSFLTRAQVKFCEKYARSLGAAFKASLLDRCAY